MNILINSASKILHQTFLICGALILVFPSNLRVFALDVVATANSGDNQDLDMLVDELQPGPNPNFNPDFSPDSTADGTILPTADNLKFQAINPGYASNAGEFIELVRLSEQPIDMTGVSLRYTGSGDAIILYTFPDQSIFMGDSIILRYASSPEVKSSDSTIANDLYVRTIAMSGSLEIIYSETTSLAPLILQSLCWTGKPGCYSKFTSKTPTTLVLNDEYDGSQVENQQDIGALYTHIDNYQPIYQADALYFAPDLDSDSDLDSSLDSEDGLVDSSEMEPEIQQCFGLEFSEILTYYISSKSEQFIEFINASEKEISLPNCNLRYKNKVYNLGYTDQETVLPGERFVYYPSDDNLVFTKNPTTSNLFEIVNNGGNVVDILRVPHGQRSNTSYAAFYNGANKVWYLTYNISIGTPNVYQEFRTCPAGKVLNQTTGNCIKSVTETVLSSCPEGKIRNPLTGRCKSVADTDNSPTECKVGYERNPETNRCRKIRVNDGASYELATIDNQNDTKSFAALGSIIGLMVVGVGFVVFQFRKEICYFVCKVFRRK